MPNKKILIIYLTVINMIMSLGIAGNAFAAAAGIYTTPALAFDTFHNLWVYVGTGDKTDPAGSEASDKFYAIKDSDRTTTYVLNNLENITNDDSYANDPDKHGWYWVFGGRERCLAEPMVTNKKVYLTSYIPQAGSSGCTNTGVSNLYCVDYLTGEGAFADGRSASVGSGIASAPVASINPYTGTTDIYVSTSNASAGVDSHTFKVTDPNTNNAASTSTIYWRDRRLQ